MLNTSKDNSHGYLSDITENIHLESNFCIYHPNYKSFRLSTRIVERLQKTAPELQKKYLHILVKNFIYGIYFSGKLKDILSSDSQQKKYLPSQDIENNSIVGIDWQFYQKLHSSNHGVGYFDPGWQVLRLEPDGSIAVVKNGLHLHIEPEWLIESPWKYPKIDHAIAVWMNNHQLDNGFYVGMSNLGAEQSHQADTQITGGRIYFNVIPAGAIALMDSFTTHLNNAGMSFRFQVLYNPDAYQRIITGILCFDCRDYSKIIKVVKTAYQENQYNFRPEIPICSKYLAPGMSFAEEPVSNNSPAVSFGIQRSQIIADALIYAWEKGKKTSESKLRVIRQYFAHLGLDLQSPYLNPHSRDIYD